MYYRCKKKKKKKKKKRKAGVHVKYLGLFHTLLTFYGTVHTMWKPEGDV